MAEPTKVLVTLDPKLSSDDVRAIVIAVSRLRGVQNVQKVRLKSDKSEPIKAEPFDLEAAVDDLLKDVFERFKRRFRV